MKFVKSSCAIKSWESIYWKDYINMPAAKHFKDSPYVSEHDIYFKATIVRGQGNYGSFFFFCYQQFNLVIIILSKQRCNDVFLIGSARMLRYLLLFTT